MKPVVVLISGRGSNMDALLAAGVPVSAVIANRADARGLESARSRGVRIAVVEHRAFASRDAFDAALAAEIDRHEPALVALAGFMRVLTPAFVARYAGRLMNIHPSLLPAFPGLDTHRRACVTGARLHGATVHFVSTEVDSGPILAQVAVPVLPDDDAERLGARVLRVEHRLYPMALKLVAGGAAQLAGDRVVYDRDVMSATDAALFSPPDREG